MKHGTKRKERRHAVDEATNTKKRGKKGWLLFWFVCCTEFYTGKFLGSWGFSRPLCTKTVLFLLFASWFCSVFFFSIVILFFFFFIFIPTCCSCVSSWYRLCEGAWIWLAQSSFYAFPPVYVSFPIPPYEIDLL